MYLNSNCVDPEDDACMAEEDLGIQLEEWEGSEEKQDVPSISAIEDSLMFESKNKILFGNSLFLFFVQYTWAYTYTLTHQCINKAHLHFMCLSHKYTRLRI